jgi:hypothetical protein
MRTLTTPWGSVDIDVDGPGACELWLARSGATENVGLYDDETEALADIENQHRKLAGGAWRITQATPSGDPLPVYLRQGDAWAVVGTADTRAAAKTIARGRPVAYRADCFGPNGDESWEIIE